MRRLLSLLCLCATALGCRGPAAPRRPSALALAYDVTPSADAATLSVRARVGPGPAKKFSVDSLAEPFVKNVTVDGLPVSPTDTSWLAPTCTGGCEIRYEYALRDAAKKIEDVDRALLHGSTVVAPPSTWLLRPLLDDGRGPVSVTVHGDRFASGFFGEGPTWHADLSDLPDAPYAAFGKLQKRVLRFPGGVMDVRFAEGELGAPETDVLAWMQRSGELVSAFYGTFPVPRVLVVVLPVPGRELFGKTLGNGGASIVLFLGQSAVREDFDDDWIMPHELIHLALPSLPFEQRWLEEGLSTYVEPIARFRAGNLPRERLWRELFAGLPQGLPAADDKGLDRTPTWGRTYWGGALFCLVADVEIRKRTHGALGLEDALRAILQTDGNVGVRREIRDILRTGDAATGTHVLSELYEAWRETPVRVDLPRLARELGVSITATRTTFVDGAPFAHVRQAIEGVSRNPAPPR